MPSTKVTKSELNALSSKFSIKNFVADLPRLLNEAFSKIVNCITYFYDPDEEIIRARKAEVTYIDATTIVAQNLKFKADNGQIYTLDNIAEIISDLQNNRDSVTNITRSQIDALNVLPLQSWPLYADYYETTPSTPSDGCKVLVAGGVKVWSSSSSSWTTNSVDDGTIYLVADTMHVYQYSDGQGWMDLGSYPNQ